MTDAQHASTSTRGSPILGAPASTTVKRNPGLVPKGRSCSCCPFTAPSGSNACTASAVTALPARTTLFDRIGPDEHLAFSAVCPLGRPNRQVSRVTRGETRFHVRASKLSRHGFVTASGLRAQPSCRCWRHVERQLRTAVRVAAGRRLCVQSDCRPMTLADGWRVRLLVRRGPVAASAVDPGGRCAAQLASRLGLP